MDFDNAYSDSYMPTVNPKKHLLAPTLSV